MTTHKLELVHVSYSKIYRVGGVTFEWHDGWFGPLIINRHTEKERPFRSISRRNWAAINKFLRMTKEQRENHRIH